jgi:hypothetical protein
MININKTKELIKYIAFKLKDKPNYGSTLLNKALYFIDAMNHVEKGDTITGLDYIKQDWGQTPKPQEFLPIRDALYISGEIEKIENIYFGQKQIKYISKEKPKMSDFNIEEIQLIDDILETLSPYNAKNISDFSHSLISWKFAKDKEELPFYTFLLTRKEPDSNDYNWAKKTYNRIKKQSKNA